MATPAEMLARLAPVTPKQRQLLDAVRAAGWTVTDAWGPSDLGDGVVQVQHPAQAHRGLLICYTVTGDAATEQGQLPVRLDTVYARQHPQDPVVSRSELAVSYSAAITYVQGGDHDGS